MKELIYTDEYQEVYYVRNALTETGIIKIKVRGMEDPNKYRLISKPNNIKVLNIISRRDIALTKEEAISKVTNKKIIEIQKLKKAIDRLENLVIKIEDL